MNQVANFDAASLESAMIEYGPAQTIVSGKTMTEKKLSIIANTTRSVHAFALSQGGKVAKAAAGNMAMDGIVQIGKQARSGNYKPLADALALVTADSVYITNRASFESLEDRYSPVLRQLQESGKDYAANGKLTSKAKVVMAALMLIGQVRGVIEAVDAQKDVEA